MADTILQSYLNNQFIKTTEEGNISNLKKAVEELNKLLQRKKAKIPSYCLVALDPQISESDPVVIEVERIIIKKWPAFKNSVTSTKDKATNYIRAVILESLSKLVKDPKLNALVWLSSRNLVKYYNLSGEKGVISEFLINVGNRNEVESQRAWGQKNEIDIPEYTSQELKISSHVVSESYLKKRLYSSAGPTRGSSQEANEDEVNPHWPSANYNWVESFGDIAAEAIAGAVNAVVNTQNKNINSLNGHLKSELKSIGPFLQSLGRSIVLGTEANNKRSQLLWWKESLYSPTLGTTYRGLTPFASAVIMAYDLSTIVDVIYPESVDYILRETLKAALSTEADHEYTMKELITQSLQIDKGITAQIERLKDTQEGRKPIIHAMANSLNGAGNDILRDIGIDGKQKVSLVDFSVWLFNDLQSRKISIEK